MALKKKLLLVSFAAILAIALVNYFALKFDWYYTKRWVDTLIHMLGGFWVAVTALLIALQIGHIETIINYKRKAFVVMFLSVLAVGVLWEIFEVLVGNARMDASNYWNDTTFDLINNFIGAVLAYWYFMECKICKMQVIKENSKIKIQK